MNKINHSRYKITVSHPSDYWKGDYFVVVSKNGKGILCCTSDDFGCSRDYNGNDESAILGFMSEHNCKVTKIEKI